MKENHYSSILEQIERLKKIPLKEDLLSGYDVKVDLENEFIGEFTVPDFISLFNQMLKQFEIELEESWSLLPYQYQFQNEFGNGNLISDFQNLLNHLKDKNYTNALGFLRRLIYFQIINGFWDKSKRKIHKASEVRIGELKEKLSLLSDHLLNYSKEIGKQLQLLESSKVDLDEFRLQKEEELEQISNSLTTARNQSNEISELLNESTSTNEKISSIFTTQKENLRDIRKSKTAIEEYNTNISEKLDEFVKQVGEFKEHLKFVESKRSFFEERNDYLENLIGREVGASLFETFNKRMGELKSPVLLWRRIVTTTSFFTLVVVVGIFTNLFGVLGDIPMEFSWQVVLVNAIKSLPFFFFLYYTIQQYNKERNFQEEYAFKSAVALTIKAYADIINREENRDELIKKSVEEIYRTPIMQKFRRDREISSITDLTKNLMDTLKETLGKK